MKGGEEGGTGSFRLQSFNVLTSALFNLFFKLSFRKHHSEKVLPEKKFKMMKKVYQPLLACATCPGSSAELWRNGPMPFVWKQLGIQTQSVQLWRDAGKDQRPSRDRDRDRQRAVGKEQRSEKVESTKDLKNSMCVCVFDTHRLMPQHHSKED